MQLYIWRTNRLLILLEPEKYYAKNFFWEQQSGRFLGYYINFQLPFKRTSIGFDMLDLELDLIIAPDFHWQWKDWENYQQGISSGVIRREWVEQIENGKKEVFDKFENRLYPFDGSWLDWVPDPSWQPPPLPENWDKI